MWSVNDTANNVKPSKHNEQSTNVYVQCHQYRNFSAQFSDVFSTEDGKMEDVWKRPQKIFFELVGLNGKLKVHFFS